MSSRPTYQQLEALADFLHDNPGIAKGVLRSAHGKHQTKEKWDAVSTILNALGGAQKDGKGWAKYWADKKCALKKTCAQHAQSMRRTGGGTAEAVNALTPIDQQLVAVMGGLQFAAGDPQLAVNPFPSTSQTQNSVELEEITVEAVLEVPASPMQNTRPSDRAVPTRTLSPSPPRQRSPLQAQSTSQRQNTRAGRTVLDNDRDRFAAIESQRVEAEAITARALSLIVEQMAPLTAAIEGISSATRAGAKAVEQMAPLTVAIEGMSTATREGAQLIADALNNIATALQREHR